MIRCPWREKHWATKFAGQSICPCPISSCTFHWVLAVCVLMHVHMHMVVGGCVVCICMPLWRQALT